MSTIDTPFHSPSGTPVLRQRTSWGTKVLAVIVILLVGTFVKDLAGNPVMRWHDVGRFLFDPRVLTGVGNTIALTATSMTLGVFLAIVVAQMRLSQSAILNAIAVFLVWFFRAVPLLVLLILIYNIGLIYPRIGLTIPLLDLALFDFNAQSLITPFIAGVIAFSCHECAYGSEIVRSAMQAVPKGQVEAAETLGLSRWTIMRRTILPQALKIALPPMMNNLISMLKGTSLVAFISMPDLLFSSQMIYMQNYDLIIPMLMVVSIWYIALVSVLTLLQIGLEAWLSPGTRRFPLALFAYRKASR